MTDSPAANDASLWPTVISASLLTAQIVSLLSSGVTTVGLALFVYQLMSGAHTHETAQLRCVEQV